MFILNALLFAAAFALLDLTVDFASFPQTITEQLSDVVKFTPSFA